MLKWQGTSSSIDFKVWLAISQQRIMWQSFSRKLQDQTRWILLLISQLSMMENCLKCPVFSSCDAPREADLLLLLQLFLKEFSRRAAKNRLSQIHLLCSCGREVYSGSSSREARLRKREPYLGKSSSLYMKIIRKFEAILTDCGLSTWWLQKISSKPSHSLPILFFNTMSPLTKFLFRQRQLMGATVRFLYQI